MLCYGYYKIIKKNIFFLLSFFSVIFSLYAQDAPGWMQNLEREFPARDWVAVTAQGSSQPQAEAAVMNALARAFKTDVSSITQASQQFSQIVSDSAGSKNVNFTESKNFSQEITTSASMQGLIGVQIDVYRAPDRTVYVQARMNRRECSARYSGLIKENTAAIDHLLSQAAALRDQASLDVYARLSFAHKIALVTDNFQNILEVLDPSTAGRRPHYGGANAIKTKMNDAASKITISITVDAEQAADKTLFTRAAGTLFRDMGFKLSEQGKGSYALKANVRFESITQAVVSCRYFLDAVLEGENGRAIFSFTEDNRKAHPNNASEARRLAARGVETSFKEGQFAREFDAWLNELVH